MDLGGLCQHAGQLHCPVEGTVAGLGTEHLARGVDRQVAYAIDEADALIRSTVKLPAGYAALWSGQYEAMARVRERLGAADNEVPGLGLAALADQNGLFAMLPLSKEQIASLREDHGIYMAGSGRINVAGLHAGNTEKFIAALGDVTKG